MAYFLWPSTPPMWWENHGSFPLLTAQSLLAGLERAGVLIKLEFRRAVHSIYYLYITQRLVSQPCLKQKLSLATL